MWEDDGMWGVLGHTSYTQDLLESAAASGATGGLSIHMGKLRSRDVTSQVPWWAELDPGQGRRKIVFFSVTSHSSEGEPRLSS